MKNFALALLICACGSAKREAYPQKSASEDLAIAAGRVEPLLLRCDGLPGKLPCESVERQSDNLGMAGYYRLAKADARIDEAVRASIDPDGRPWRSPTHRHQRAGDFSRDHVVSLAQWSLGARDKDVLIKVINYARSNDWKVCSADKCLLTPGLLSAVGDVVSFSGGTRPAGTNIPAVVHEARILAESERSDRCDLVADKILLKAWTNNLTKAYVNAAKQCANRQPTLYTRYVRSLCTGEPRDAIVRELTARLNAWSGPTAGGHWGADANGWALVALATWLK